MHILSTQAAGFEEQGRELLRNAETGEMIPCRMFIGLTSYMKLAHIADMKAHARAKDGGPKNPATGEPNKGKAQLGGPKFGEQERAATIAQGGSKQCQEWGCDLSAPKTVLKCDGCGMDPGEEGRCPVCG